MHPVFRDARRRRSTSPRGLRLPMSTLVGLAVIVILGQGACAAHAQSRQLIEKGRSIVALNCARCHSIEKSGTSPFPAAPPFRDLSTKYPLEHLAEALAEGIMSGHPAMPEYIFSPNEIDAILAYLASLDVPR